MRKQNLFDLKFSLEYFQLIVQLILVFEMSPRKHPKSLFSISLEYFVKQLIKHIDKKSLRLNFFNDFDGASKSFLSRCVSTVELLDDYFVGTLR